MTNNNEKVIKMLDKNDYRVVLHAIGNGCLAYFPTVLERPLCPKQVLHSYYGDQIEEDYDNKDSVINECPIYAQRLYTLYTIIQFCNYIGYDVSLIKFLIDDREITEEEFMALLIDNFDDNIIKENMIVILVKDLLSGNIDMESAKQIAQSNGVEEGLSKLLGIVIQEEQQ